MHICRLVKVSLSVRLNIIHMCVYVICIWQVYSNIVRFICGMKRESSDVSLLTLKRLSIHTVPKFGNFSFNKPFVRPKSCIGGRHLMDIISWTKEVTFRGHFCPREVLSLGDILWTFLGDFSWTFFG